MARKLTNVTGKEAIKAFSQIGFHEVRKRGSHCILKKDGHPDNLTIPDHGGKPLKQGLLIAQVKLAGLTVEQFEELL